MSQSALNIPNESGASFRADVNTALQALASLSSGNTAPSTTYAYQFWVDTSGANPILKIRNGANSAWVTVGRVDLTNMGFLTLAAGGVIAAAVSFSNTDYFGIPIGTTAQRPGSPSAGMMRYNTDLSVFEGYRAGAWNTLGGGGGGGSLRWISKDNAPIPSVDSYGNEIQSFTLGLGQQLYTLVKVPHGYTAGSQVKLYLPFYSPDSSGTALLQTVATLIRPGTTVISSTTNQRTSTNSAVTLGSGTVNIPQMVTFDLSDSTGKINGVSIQADDIIAVALTRGSDTGASDLAALINSAETTFN
jgi:hypothetical protein